MTLRHEEDVAFVLHTYPYSETSLIAEVLTRNHGRLGVVAKGAKRPRSALRGVLHAFQPLVITWFGKSELRTLGRAEWQAALPQLSGTAMMCGFYLNELILKLTRRDDPHEALFDFYSETVVLLRDIAPSSAKRGARQLQGMTVAEPASTYAMVSPPVTNEASRYGPLLRRFELSLLKELGYAVSLDRDVESGVPVSASRQYEYLIERGPVAVQPDPARFQLRGQTLLDVARRDYTDPVTLQEAKQLMRQLLNHYLGGQPLHTRQLIRDLREI